MSKSLTILAGAALALVSAAAASAHPGGSHAGGTPSGSSGGATSVPEPADAILLLMGAAGVVIGRRLHARAKKDD